MRGLGCKGLIEGLRMKVAVRDVAGSDEFARPQVSPVPES